MVGSAPNNRKLLAFSETNGATLWQQSVSGTSGTVAVSADGVYASAPCTTFDLRPATGETVWTNNTGCEGGGGDTPVVANGVLYSPINGNYSGTSFDAETGKVLGDFSASDIPAITADTAFMLSNGTLQAIALSNNQILWSFAGDGSLDTAPIAINDYVIVGSSSGNVYALDAGTGAQVWMQNVGAGVDTSSSGTVSMSTGLAAGDGLLVIPAGNEVIAYQLSRTRSLRPHRLEGWLADGRRCDWHDRAEPGTINSRKFPAEHTVRSTDSVGIRERRPHWS